MIKRIHSSLLKWVMLGVVMSTSLHAAASELSESLKKSDRIVNTIKMGKSVCLVAFNNRFIMTELFQCNLQRLISSHVSR